MRKIIFVTGTRADYGKLKSIIKNFQKKKKFKTLIFATGMHNLEIFGNTFTEIKKDKIRNVYRYFNQNFGDDMSTIMANTILGFNLFVKKTKPDLIVVHGDRPETLACACVGSFQNIKVAHIEGGEISGTIDELIRHAVSKMSHIHMTSNAKAKKRLIQMGEKKKNIFVIGSPDIDILLNKNLPTIQKVKKRYDIKFSKYLITIFHPVTTELNKLKKQTDILVKVMKETNRNYVLIYPNNDSGSKIILKEFLKLKNHPRFRVLPSMRFEHYLTLLKHSELILGNSSSGIMEAPYYGVSTINLGTRQNKRADIKSVNNVTFNKNKIKSAISKYVSKRKFHKPFYFGKGDSFKKFIKVLNKKKVWSISSQKYFEEIN